MAKKSSELIDFFYLKFSSESFEEKYTVEWIDQIKTDNVSPSNIHEYDELIDTIKLLCNFVPVDDLYNHLQVTEHSF